MHLDNPPDNPCFGCGPGVARGLRLGFQRLRAPDGVDEVVAEHVPRGDEIGWPGLFHTGLHFTVLYEASYWGAWELTGKVHTSHGDSLYQQQRLPRVGKPFRAHARLAGTQDGSVVVDARSVSDEGKPLATLRTLWKQASRERLAKAGLDLPDYIVRDLAP